MIDFGRFYQQIAVGPLSHWLETLPAQLSAWKTRVTRWFFFMGKMLDNLPVMVPTDLDLRNSVTASTNPSSQPVKLGA